MASRHSTLLDEIERDALRSELPVADVLRKVITLGGKVGSTALRDWASRELRGYGGSGEDLPSYRKPTAVIQIDAINGSYQITGQQVSPSVFPEGIRDHIEEAVPLGQGIGEIEAMLRQADNGGGTLKMTLPGAQDLARLWDREVGDPYQHVTAIYWSLSRSAIAGVIDQVRTTLVELAAEMRAGMPPQANTPSGTVA
ncbi:unnamed protein product, partial [Phaeothamnion confervicola]